MSNTKGTLSLEQMRRMIEDASRIKDNPISVMISDRLPLNHWFKYVELAGHTCQFTREDGKIFELREINISERKK